MGTANMQIVRKTVGRPLQIVGFVLWGLAALGALLWTWFVLFSAFGVLGLFIGLIFTPITAVLAVLIVWFSTGMFPFGLLILWLGSWAGLILAGIGGLIAGDE